MAPVSLVSIAPSCEKVNGINNGEMFISRMRGVIHLQRAILVPLKMTNFSGGKEALGFSSCLQEKAELATGWLLLFTRNVALINVLRIALHKKLQAWGGHGGPPLQKLPK